MPLGRHIRVEWDESDDQSSRAVDQLHRVLRAEGWTPEGDGQLEAAPDNFTVFHPPECTLDDPGGLPDR